MFWFQAKKSFFEGKKCRNQCEFSSMINWQSGCSRHPLVLQMPHFIWKNLVQHFVFYSFFCFFSLWLSPSGKHQMDILKLQKKKDLNKRFLGRAIFRITRLFLVFLNVHPQYICLPPNYIAAASTLGREPMGKVRKTISILGVSRRPEKNCILSATTWGNQPTLYCLWKQTMAPSHIHGPHVCIVFNIRNSSEAQNLHYFGHRTAKCHR